jgi:uncharacterized phage protein gp47/JayE
LENKLLGANTKLRVNNLRVFAEVEAGSAHLLYGRLEWSFRQLFPDTAELEFLERWASIWGVRRSPATRAFGPVRATAEPGSSVLTGDLLQLEGGDTQFRVRLGVPAIGGNVDFTVDAVAYGMSGNVPVGPPPGTVLRFLSTRVGIAPIAYVQPNGIVGGADQDTDEELLAALLNRIQQPPHGGNHNDYVRWTLDVSGVTRAWCYPLERGLGTVAVRFMMDDVRAADLGIPTNGDCEFVWNYLSGARPVTADIGPDEALELPGQPVPTPWGWGYVFPPWPKPQPVTIATLNPDTPEVRAAIAAGLADMMRHETSPGETLQLRQYYLAIGSSPGVRQYRLIEPAADVTSLAGEIITLPPELLTFEP